MGGIGWSAWLLVLTSACRWGFEKQPVHGGDDVDAGIDAAGDPVELCTDHWCWEHPPGTALRSLRAISGSSPTNVWAVGDGGLIRRWDGASWTVQEIPTYEALTAVDVVSESDVTVAAGAGAVWHFDGGAWTQSQLASNSTVAAFWRAPDGKLWEAGDIGTISIDGVAATGVPTGYAATGLDGTSPIDVWHTGVFNAVSHWGGASWISTLIADFPTAVLARNNAAFVGGSAIWSCDTSISCTQLLAGVFVRDFVKVTDANMWAVGGGGHIEHFDGASWQAVTSPVTTNLTALWASAANDIWAVGEDGTIIHFDGAGWTALANQTPIGTGWIAFWVGADTDRWLGAGNNKMFHSDGGDPVEVALPSGARVGDELEGNAQDDVYSYDIGNHGVLHFDGNTWSLDPSLTTLSSGGGGLATNATETLVSNLSGAIYRKPAGGSFSMTFNQAGTEWHGLCLKPNDDAIAVGRFGSGALRTSGTWTANNPPTGRFMVACSFAGTAGWAIGGDTLVKLSGATWQDIGAAMKTRQNLDDVLAVSDTEVYIVAGAGRIVRFDGASWAEEPTPVATDFTHLARSTSGTIYAAGHSPGMFHRR